MNCPPAVGPPAIVDFDYGELEGTAQGVVVGMRATVNGVDYVVWRVDGNRFQLAVAAPSPLTREGFETAMSIGGSVKSSGEMRSTRKARCVRCNVINVDASRCYRCNGPVR